MVVSSKYLPRAFVRNNAFVLPKIDYKLDTPNFHILKKDWVWFSLVTIGFMMQHTPAF
jgi:hypothetical protein